MKIFSKYILQGQSPSTEIGRVYVYDRDDWDIADKTFKWLKDEAHPYFSLNRDTGMITMKHGVREGHYSLKFRVQDRKHTQGWKFMSCSHCQELCQ